VTELLYVQQLTDIRIVISLFLSLEHVR